jgi:diguanylate cyclase (GGDEF)-like protein
MFMEQLEGALARARRSGRSLAIVFVDLDDFKVVNDTRGHDVGDVLLSTLTPRLTEAIREGDMLARLGGDEFVVLCEDLPSEDRAMEVAQRLVDVSRRPLEVAGQDHAISLSAGVVLVSDPQRATVHEVLRDADAAMYTAKAGGKGRASLFDQSARERLVERVEIESLLRGARKRDELELHYQPVVALRDTRPVSVEALLRWRHPDRGLLSPGAFMEIAESAGLSAEIGEWVLETACAQAVVWRDTLSRAEPLPVSVNVSAYELARTNLSVVVQRVLAATGLEPGLLELEVTESALLGDVTAARRELERLKALGVRLVVDDFGTGYSSLTALRSLSIDELKLDRSFVQGLSDDGSSSSLIEAVLGLAKAIQANVTAEGVETWEQVSQLRSVGCDFAQGYLFARPAAAAEATALLSADQAPESVGR